MRERKFTYRERGGEFYILSEREEIYVHNESSLNLAVTLVGGRWIERPLVSVTFPAAGS